MFVFPKFKLGTFPKLIERWWSRVETRNGFVKFNLPFIVVVGCACRWLSTTRCMYIYILYLCIHILHIRPIVLVPHNVTRNYLSVLFYWPTLRARSRAELSNFPHLFSTRLFGSIFSRRLLSPRMVATMALSSDSLQKKVFGPLPRLSSMMVLYRWRPFTNYRHQKVDYMRGKSRKFFRRNSNILNCVYAFVKIGHYFPNSLPLSSLCLSCI